MRLLTFTTLYPNPAQPNHGVFVENRLRHLVGTGAAQADVLAPVPWFFGRGPADMPPEERRHDLRVLHPRWLSIPAIGMRVAPASLYHTARRSLAALIAAGARYDAIDAHYFFPDGVAAIRLGRRFGLPVVITARGSDITQFPDYPAARRHILAAAAAADAIVTVSAGLREALLALGAPAGKITILRNGVDLAMFRPEPVAASRARWGLGAGDKLLVSVGGLIPRKGHDRTIAALAQLPGWLLLIAGEGPEKAALLAQAARLGLGARVRLLGGVPHEALRHLYSAADLSVLASSREGWANVLLESMACGTPVVASPIPGNPEVVGAPAAGLIARENSADGLADAVRSLMLERPSRAATRAYAEGFGWDATSAGQLRIFRSIRKNEASS